MDALIGTIGFLLFGFSIIMMIFQRKKHCKLWLLGCCTGFILFALAISMPSEKNQPTTTQTHTQNKLEQQSAKQVLDDFIKYLSDNFRNVWWYSLIKDVELTLSNDGKAIISINTEIYPDKEGENVAKTIAQAVYWYDKIEIKSLTIKGQNGHIIYIN